MDDADPAKKEEPAFSFKKYLDPDRVTATDPATASPFRGDVVIASPSLNALEPVMIPDTEPSRFCFHLERTGTPFGTSAALGLVGASFSSSPPAKKLKRRIVAPGFAS